MVFGFGSTNQTLHLLRAGSLLSFWTFSLPALFFLEMHMKQPSGRQMQVYLSNQTYEEVINKADENQMSASSFGRKSIEFILECPFIEWVNGEPIIKKDSK